MSARVAVIFFEGPRFDVQDGMKKQGPGQMDLFGEPIPSEAAPPEKPEVELAEVDPQLKALRSALPPNLRLGTSSWSFPGWSGLVYEQQESEQDLARSGLSAYSRHPLLSTVGVDRSYYSPLAPETWASYASSVPDDFQFLVKAHEHCTLSRFSNHKRHGDKRGMQNTLFLEARYAAETVIDPCLEGLGAKAGVMLFQFAPQASRDLGGVWGFADRLHEFLSALPRGLLYAVELRNAELLTPPYAAALADTRVSHCITIHPSMPSPAEQFELTSGCHDRALVVRWMLHAEYGYDEAKAEFEPFDRLVDPDPVSRTAISELVKEVSPETPAWVIVNNKAEGSAPLSIVELAKEIVGEGECPADA